MSTVIEAQTPDGNVVAAVASGAANIMKKALDVNKYATKKTIAQGLLDVALLTANASQLKYVLQVGEKHEFYALMLTLISISIVLQVTAGLLSVFVAILKSYNDEKINDLVNILNQISLGFVTGALFCDVIKMNFGLDPAIAINVVQACLCVLLGTALNINKEGDCPNANRANNLIFCANLVIMAVNVVISSFEMKDVTNIFDKVTDVTTTPSP